MSPRPYRRFSNRPSRPGGRSGGGRRGGHSNEQNSQTAVLAPPRPQGPVELPSILAVGELAEALGLAPAQVIKTLIGNGIFATQNQEIDFETAAIVASDLGFEVTERAATAVGDDVDRVTSADGTVEEDPDRVSRPPVVTVMGHVDHGKTSLLDAIRETRVTAREAGGITQHIGAYQVEYKDRKVTFLDTPGHEAFTAMRARGAQITDVAILVVAADDGVQPQTIEAIAHVKAAAVPIVVALNKMDKADANPDQVKAQLAEHGVTIEDYGGDTPLVAVPARSKMGLDDLLETVLLVADVAELTAHPDRPA